MMFTLQRNRRRADVARRSDERLGTKRKYSVLVAVAFLGVTWGVWKTWQWASASPRFALKEVIFHGLKHATETELSHLGGLTAGVNVLALDLDEAERTLANHPWVKSVRLRRLLPSKLEVIVDERIPVLLLATGAIYLVDADAMPFKRVAPGDEFDLPMVTGIDRKLFVEDRKVALRDLAQAVYIAKTYKDSLIAKTHPLSEVHVADGELTLVTMSGVVTHFGNGSIEEKMIRFRRVHAALAERRLSAKFIRLDNRVRPSRVTVRLK